MENVHDSRIVTHLDIPYKEESGEREREHFLDLYVPAEASQLPVLVYVHGGKWKGGDKSRVSQKPMMFCNAGFLFVSVNYRLIPENVSLDEGTQRILNGVFDHTVQGKDVVQAISWVHAEPLIG